MDSHVVYLRRLIAMSHSPSHYRLVSEVKIRRESFGGILYKYGCADRGSLSFINSPQLIDLLLLGQREHGGDVSAAIESRRYSETSKQKLYTALDDLVKRGYLQVQEQVPIVP
jgi:putative mycofactocin binding protein MftB